MRRPIYTTGMFSERLSWFGTVRASPGAEPSDRLLVYVTGGLGHGEVQSGVSVSNTVGLIDLPGTTVTANSNSTQVSWTVGAGLEWAFAGHPDCRVATDHGLLSLNESELGKFATAASITSTLVIASVIAVAGPTSLRTRHHNPAWMRDRSYAAAEGSYQHARMHGSP